MELHNFFLIIKAILYEYIAQVSEDRLPYKFATTLIFTNGLCPFCKEQVYEHDGGGLNMKADIEK